MEWTLALEFNSVVVKETLGWERQVSQQLFPNYSLVVNAGLKILMGCGQWWERQVSPLLIPYYSSVVMLAWTLTLELDDVCGK